MQQLMNLWCIIQIADHQRNQLQTSSSIFSLLMHFADFVAERCVSARLSDPPRRFQGKYFSYKAPKRSRCSVCAYKKISPRSKARMIQRLHTGALNVKFTSVLEGALNSITQGSIIEIINISLNFHILIIILVTFVIHFFTLCNNDVKDCII